MARRSNLGLVIALVVFVGLAAFIKVCGGPILQRVQQLHGSGGGGH